MRRHVFVFAILSTLMVSGCTTLTAPTLSSTHLDGGLAHPDVEKVAKRMDQIRAERTRARLGYTEEM